MKHTILLVDDDDLILKGTGIYLKKKGYQVTTADSGEKAVDLLNNNVFDLVITDLVMDGIDGIQVLKKAKERNPEIMVIILTGHGDLSSAIDAIRLDADDYLLKPCHSTELDFRVSHCLKQQVLKRELKQAENEIKKLESLGVLAGGIAHQFNNALCAIIGNIDLFEMDFPDEENVAAYAQTIKDSARRMAQLTTQLLAYARGGKYQAETVLFSDFVREILPLVKHTLGSTINVDTDLPLGIHNVKADLTQMQIVLSAVLTNATEAMEGKGHIRVACRNTIITDETVRDFPGLTPGNYVNLTIADDGKGMDEETRTRIFEPFFTTKFEGRGLGMAAVYGIVKNHGGWISVDSELVKGSVVKIYLPAVEAPVREDVKPNAKWVKGTGTILIIDDEEMIINVCRAILEQMGYRVLEAKTGQEAIDVVKTFDGDIDLALLDILLPDMNGNAIYPFLMDARPDLKVIVFSGYSIDGPAQEILDAGAEDFIPKPFTIAALSEKLKKTLKH